MCAYFGTQLWAYLRSDTRRLDKNILKALGRTGCYRDPHVDKRPFAYVIVSLAPEQDKQKRGSAETWAAYRHDLGLHFYWIDGAACNQTDGYQWPPSKGFHSSRPVIILFHVLS
ncbi:hypothetical protein AN958_11584 [Leucoagaricus sp. SymC.cos]|nr:hypothetical protein AN958_11584 [Leucoagaricus sp. SymC.cos]